MVCFCIKRAFDKVVRLKITPLSSEEALKSNGWLSHLKKTKTRNQHPSVLLDANGCKLSTQRLSKTTRERERERDRNQIYKQAPFAKTLTNKKYMYMYLTLPAFYRLVKSPLAWAWSRMVVLRSRWYLRWQNHALRLRWISSPQWCNLSLRNFSRYATYSVDTKSHDSRFPTQHNKPHHTSYNFVKKFSCVKFLHVPR